MNWTVILAYVAIVLIAGLGLSVILVTFISLITSVIFRPFGQLVSIKLGSLLSGIIIWFLIDFVWQSIVDGHIPVLGIGLAYLANTFYYISQKDQLSEFAKPALLADRTAIILLGIYIVIDSGFDWV